eukprot:CAMPEP_0119216014 /NCGR_PEP_ID=MMETSP1327-20130426/13940_1 /TAXON_ID=38833 /ORGANISM="Micromonas pusilla, Strain RCC2306" /LENGTH=423 /DNA_ID=CAMNT_0007213899 /DNA_START=8 /DNA_END=1279 /DNA_ORIENTATION=-
MPRVSTRAPKGVCVALGAFFGVIGLIVWASFQTFARAAEHRSVIGSFDHLDPAQRHGVSRNRHEPRFGTERHGGGVGSRVGIGSRVKSVHEQHVLEAHEVSDITERSTARAEGSVSSSKEIGDEKTRRERERVDASDATSRDDSSAPTCGDSKPHTEYWGDVVAAATPATNVLTSAECCASCLATSGCNVWVHCSVTESNDPSAKWCDQQCWLKRVDDPTSPTAHDRGDTTPWTSGVLLKDYDKSKIDANQGEPGSDVGEFADANPGGAKLVTIATSEGDMTVRLKPDWHLPSVKFIQRLVTEKGCAGGSCHLYRVEPGFLVQGTMASFTVAANTRTRRGPKLMERGDIGWAGGSAGPDFFVYLGKFPADWLGHDHTVFGVLADEQSLAVAEKIVGSDSHTPGGANTMRFLREKLSFDVVAAT